MYLTIDSTNPSTRLGYGTWVRYGEGKAIVGVSSPNSTNPAWTKYPQSEFGTYQETITFPTDNWAKNGNAITTSVSGRIVVGSGNTETAEILESLAQAAEIRTQLVNNVQPSITVNIWLRTA